ncbi:MAG TPA: UDP-glucose 4-epimerase GalE [Sporichthyaceae bacterium]|jgi:UDP-glucose 4-epimerase|nr:UDP-glucose 4-epimerase GalE [Sporichthyaceae bacterium]
MSWLVTGGAGYIGAHVVRSLLDAGLDVVVLDDLSTGQRELVPDRVAFVEADVLDQGRVTATLREHGVDGVVHLAGKKSLPESVERPLFYWEQNVGGCRSLLSAMAEAGVDRIVFSSSCSVIGTPEDEFVDEETPTRPESPYGRTKLTCEWMITDAGLTGRLNWASLRYFNVVGAGAPELGDICETNLIPCTFRAITARRRPVVFGDDYPTPDGSCVRDFIHVSDLAGAHVAAAQRLDAAAAAGTDYGQVLNVGRGDGASVKEVMAVVAEVTGTDLRYEIGPRRAYDPARVVGLVEKIALDLGWKAELDLHDMVRSAWAAWQHRPH